MVLHAIQQLSNEGNGRMTHLQMRPTPSAITIAALTTYAVRTAFSSPRRFPILQSKKLESATPGRQVNDGLTEQKSPHLKRTALGTLWKLRRARLTELPTESDRAYIKRSHHKTSTDGPKKVHETYMLAATRSHMKQTDLHQRTNFTTMKGHLHPTSSHDHHSDAVWPTPARPSCTSTPRLVKDLRQNGCQAVCGMNHTP